MKLKKQSGFLVLLLAATLFVQNASATYLPDSSYAEAAGKWQGSTIHDEDGFNVLIDFAVYDTGNLQQGSDEEALADALNMDGQYIYAYQIYNQDDIYDIYEEIASFSILDINRNQISGIDDTSSYDNDDGGKAPASSDNPGIWTWVFQLGGYLAALEHSWFLVLSSDLEPVVGSYEIEGPPTMDMGVPPIPEPATIALLGIGSVTLFSKRRRSA